VFKIVNPRKQSDLRCDSKGIPDSLWPDELGTMDQIVPDILKRRGLGLAPEREKKMT
jgi:hypothetical protein